MPEVIQRWDLYDHTWSTEGCPLPPGGATMVERQKGEYVKHAGHVAEVERLEKRARLAEEALARMQKPVSDFDAQEIEEEEGHPWSIAPADKAGE